MGSNGKQHPKSHGFSPILSVSNESMNGRMPDPTTSSLSPVFPSGISDLNHGILVAWDITASS
jgi:hypothetical protein